MAVAARQETMQRKPILMPPSMIKKVDKIAKARKISFAAVVREAVNAFDSNPTTEDDAILEALAETMIKSTRDLVRKIDQVEQRLDETHAMLEKA